MSNDADQKTKFFKPEDFKDENNYAPYSCGDMASVANAKLNALIEAAPALAEIESLRAEIEAREESSLQVSIVLKAEIDKLRAENSELKIELSDREVIIGAKHINIVTLEKKLSAANAQIEKLAAAMGDLIQRHNYTGKDEWHVEVLAEYEQFKKDSK